MKANENLAPVVTQFLNITPAQLRLIADRMEAAVKIVDRGQQVIYNVSDEITSYFHPSKPAQ